MLKVHMLNFVLGGEVFSTDLPVLRGWLVWPYSKVSGLLMVISKCIYGIKCNGLGRRGG